MNVKYLDKMTCNFVSPLDTPSITISQFPKARFLRLTITRTDLSLMATTQIYEVSLTGK